MYATGARFRSRCSCRCARILQYIQSSGRDQRPTVAHGSCRRLRSKTLLPLIAANSRTVLQPNRSGSSVAPKSASTCQTRRAAILRWSENTTDGNSPEIRFCGQNDADTSNHAMERTADRSASTFEMTSTLPLRATRALVRRRSSYSR